MTTHPPILRNCVLALPVVVLAAAIAFDLTTAFQTLIAGSAALANLGLLAWTTGRYFDDVAKGGDGARWGMLLAAKLILALPVFGLLMWLLSPLAVVLGLCVVVLGVSVTGIMLAVRPGESGPGEGREGPPWTTLPKSVESVR